MSRQGVFLPALALLTITAPVLLDAQAAPGARDRLVAFRSERELLEFLRPNPVLRPAPTPPVLGLPPLAPAPASTSCAAAEATPHTTHRTTVPEAEVTGAVISGVIRTVRGQPLYGANVTIERLRISVGTDSFGRFEIALPPELVPESSFVLRARSFGYVPRVLAIVAAAGDSIVVDVALCEDVNRLSQVVVTGVTGATGSSGKVLGASITNVQHAGVDEGGIVKLHGDHLVILRRGRLFTVAMAGRSLRPVSAVDAFAPGAPDEDAWYDEMLIHDDRIVVIGYSYERGGTELNLFRIARGQLTHLSSYHLRADDYYSSRNYASRLIDGKLVFYSPLYVERGDSSALDALPALRRWRLKDDPTAFKRIVTPTDVYRAARPLDDDDLAMHAVTTCAFEGDGLDCKATVVLGPPGHVFYVSPTSVYVWASSWTRGVGGSHSTSLLYRMPLDGTAPSAIGVRGSPIDQLSFNEDGSGFLDVLVEADGDGTGMWRSESAVRGLSLLSLDLRLLGNGRADAAPDQYRTLPDAMRGELHNRFVGSYLLYGSTSRWGPSAELRGELVVVPPRGRSVQRLVLPHGVERIEPMGRQAVVIGSDGTALHFTGIRLEGEARVAQTHRVEGAGQGEQRSHGFFYRDDGVRSGVIGLPVIDEEETPHPLLRTSAAVILLRNDGTEFRRLGYLAAGPDAAKRDDRCRASCVDWYGNARPIFLGQRIFALIGYELVEGAETRFGIHETQRISFLPP